MLSSDPKSIRMHFRTIVDRAARDAVMLDVDAEINAVAYLLGTGSPVRFGDLRGELVNTAAAAGVAVRPRGIRTPSSG
jgi:hypothetical protein